MSQEINESTRVMPAAGISEDRTMVVGTPGIDRTMVAGMVPPGAGATQMGVNVSCAVCRTSNSGMEAYCSECGFLLSSAPGALDTVSQPDVPEIHLVESATGRNFRLKPGSNIVGRENCDVLLMDGTVSRRHAEVTLDGSRISITDLGSTNGSMVDGVRLGPNAPTPLAPGGTVKFGNILLTLVAPGAPAEATIALSTPAAATQVLVEPVPEPTMIGAPGAVLQTPASDETAEPIAIAHLVGLNSFAREILIHEGVYSIGRRAGNSLMITDDPYISGRHAEIQTDQSGSYLVDVGSTNGTLVNGEKLEANKRQLLLDGDEVSLGQGNYRFETLETPEEAAPSTIETPVINSAASEPHEFNFTPPAGGDPS